MRLIWSDDFAGKQVFMLDQATRRILIFMGSSPSERSIEYEWALANLPSKDPGGMKILDVGSGLAYFPNRLLTSGIEVHSLETSIPNFRKSKIHYRAADARESGYENDYFDFITIISTIEHVGLGYYGDPPFDDGDIRVMKEMRRLLVPGGKILLTTPFSDEFKVGWQRIYSEESLERLTRGFSIWREDFFTRIDRKWRMVDKTTAQVAVGKGFVANAVACLVLKK